MVGQRVVGRSTGGPLGVVVDPARGPDQHQPLHQVGAGQGEVEGEAATHRVAHVGGRSAGVAEEQRPVGEAGHHPGGAAVAGGVDQHQLVVADEVVGERPPAPAGLGEAVHQHETVAAGRADDLGVQGSGAGGHGWQRRAPVRGRP